MSLERRIDATPTPDDLDKAIGEAADAFDLQKRRAGDRWTLIGGSHFSMNPSSPGVRLGVSIDSTGVRLDAEPRAFPWTRRKVERLVDAWLGAVASFLGARLKNETPLPVRRLLSAAPDGPGRVLAAGWMLLSFAAASLLILVVTTGLGVVIVDRQVQVLRERTELISSLNVVAIPSRAELSAFGPARLLGAAALFALPGAFFSALVLGLALMLSEGFRRCQRLGLWAFVFLVIFLTLTLTPATNFVIAPAFALAIPLAGLFGYTLVWSRRREVDVVPAEPDPKRARVQLVVAVLGVAVVAAALVPWKTHGGVQTLGEMARFRDLYLLPTTGGKAFAQFYYRHTPYAAEPLKPVFNGSPESEGGEWERDQRTALLLWDDTNTQAKLKDCGFIVQMTADARRFEAELRQPYDLVVARAWDYPNEPQDPETVVDSRAVQAIREAGAEGRTVLLGDHNKGTPLGFGPDQIVHMSDEYRRPPQGPVCPCVGSGSVSPSRIRVWSDFFRTRHRGDHLADWTHYGWRAIFYVGPLVAAAVVFVPIACLFAWLFRKAPRRVALAVTGLVGLAAAAGFLALSSGGAGARRAVADLRALDVAGEGASDRILDGLKSPDAAVRYEAAYTAHQHLKAMDDPKDDRLRRAQADAALFDALLAGLHDADPRVRLWSAGALGVLKKPEALDPLIKALDDPELLVRYRAAGALGDLGNPDAIEPLLDMMAHDAWYAGQYALGALRKISKGNY